MRHNGSTSLFAPGQHNSFTEIHQALQGSGVTPSPDQSARDSSHIRSCIMHTQPERKAGSLLCDKGTALHHRRFPHWPRFLFAKTPSASDSSSNNLNEPQRSLARLSLTSMFSLSQVHSLDETSKHTTHKPHHRALTFKKKTQRKRGIYNNCAITCRRV